MGTNICKKVLWICMDPYNEDCPYYSSDPTSRTKCCEHHIRNKGGNDCRISYTWDNKDWLVLYKIDSGPIQIATYNNEKEARDFYDQLKLNWSEVLLCNVIEGPMVNKG